MPQITLDSGEQVDDTVKNKIISCLSTHMPIALGALFRDVLKVAIPELTILLLSVETSKVANYVILSGTVSIISNIINTHADKAQTPNADPTRG